MLGIEAYGKMRMEAVDWKLREGKLKFCCLGKVGAASEEGENWSEVLRRGGETGKEESRQKVVVSRKRLGMALSLRRTSFNQGLQVAFKEKDAQLCIHTNSHLDRKFEIQSHHPSKAFVY